MLAEIPEVEFTLCVNWTLKEVTERYIQVLAVVVKFTILTLFKYKLIKMLNCSCLYQIHRVFYCVR